MGSAVEQFGSIARAFFAYADAHPAEVVYSQAVPCDPTQRAKSKRVWQATSYADSAARVRAIASYLLSLGVTKGQSVAIFSGTRPEWCEIDLAILSCAAITSSLYPSLLANDAGYILFDSACQVVFAENQEQVDKLLGLISTPCPIPATENRPARQAQIQIRRIIAIEAVNQHPLVTPLSEVLRTPIDSAALEAALAITRSGDTAALVYTSGTTGPPKGVVQSHQNHLANVRQASESGAFTEDGELFLFLPLAHSFARLISYLGFLTPARLKFPMVQSTTSSHFDPASMLQDLRSANAQILPAVPRIFEKIMDGLQTRAHSLGLSAKILRLTLYAARAVYAAHSQGTHPTIFQQIVFSATSGIRAKLRKKLFGDNFHHAISGGAKLPIAVNEFFEGLGIKIYEGYGLTETCVATNVNRPNRSRIGTVGPLLADDIEILLTAEGEICYRGPNITRSYFNRPEASAESWDAQGWFHTGDLGSLDDQGFLTITGRKKELIVTAGGKKIPPQKLEDALRASPYISQAVVYGDERPYCVALLCLDPAALQGWSARHKCTLSASLHTDPQVLDLIKREVDQVNTSLASFETIKKFALLPHDLSVDNGFLTPTLKVKRKAVIAAFRQQIEDLYNS